MKILLKYPTRGRFILFKDTIKNIQDTISNECEYEIHVTCDSDDREMTIEPNDKSGLEIDHVTDPFPFLRKAKYKYGKSLSKIHAVNRDMDHITANYNWDLLIVMSDDMKFVQKDWDKEMIRKIKSIWGESTDFFAHFNDGYTCERLPTMSIMGREYYERFFYIYPPCYKSFSCDAEAMFVAQMLDRYHYFPEVLFRHEHPANNHSVANDDTYNRASKHMIEDTETYFKRMKKLFYVNNPVMIPELMKPYL